MAVSNHFPKTTNTDGAATAARPTDLLALRRRSGRGREPSGGCRIAA